MWILNDIDICNVNGKVNDNGNDNSNGGEALSDSTGLQIIIGNNNCNVNGNDNDNGSTGW